MDSGVLITNPYGMVSSYLLLRLLLKNKYRVFCFVNSSEGNMQNGLWNTLKRVAEVNGYEYSELLKVQNKLSTIPVNLETANLQESSQNDLKILKSLPIQTIWHCMEFYSWQKDSLYKKESKYHESLMKNIIYLGEFFQGARINSIHTGYLTESILQEYDVNNSDFSFERFKAYQNDKMMAEKSLLKNRLISCSIFRTPEMIGYSRSSEPLFYSSLHYCLESLDKFIRWVRGRLPEYYLRYPLTLYIGNCSLIYLNYADLLVDEILYLAEDGDFQKNNIHKAYHVNNPISISADRFAALLEKIFPDIKINLTNDFEALNYFDRMFQSKIGAMHFSFFNRAQEGSTDSKCNFKEADAPEDKLQDLLDHFIRKTRRAENDKLVKINRAFYNGVKKTIKCKERGDLDYHVFGAGQPLVLINAIGVKSEALKEVIYYLSKSYKVITWECRGVKNLKPCLEEACFTFSYEEQANDLEEILANEAINQAYLAGWCSGALIALTFYWKRPMMTKTLTLISGTYVKLEGKELNWIEDMKITSEVVKENPKMARMYIKMIVKMLFEIKKTDEYADDLGKVLEKIPPQYRKLFDTPYLNEEYLSNYCGAIGEGAALDIKDMVKDIDIPVYVVSAGNDKIVSEKQFEWAKSNIKGAKSLCVPGATHWFLTENGEEAANVLMSFWNEV